MYTIILSDGQRIENLTLNGNNFVSPTPVDETLFTYNCSPVTISDGQRDEVHEAMELLQITPMFGNYYFILRDLSAQEIWQEKISSQLAYLAMSTGTEMDI